MTPLVKKLVEQIDALLEALQRATGEIQQMRDEIAVLKGKKAKPKFKSSKMDKNTDKNKDQEGDDDEDASPADGDKVKRAGSAKRSKTAGLQIHEDRVIAPSPPIPADARFKGYRDFVVQGLVIKAHNIRYRLESWLTVEGHWLTGELPASVQGHHSDAELRSFILHQHNHCHVTQPLLLEQLRQWDVDISAG
ncbi:MAG: hypothetical protein Q8R67_09140 [Rhodoferax sp.]|nr:hypothetical protein [Rhodoferax sp.]MDP3651835.1 hypothetical protein [Rhodoferax sp.]